MSDFKAELAKYGVPLAISDDWDRGVYQTGSGLTDFGQKVNALDDLTMAHSIFLLCSQKLQYALEKIQKK
jgi:hypothetical protein